MEQIIILNVDGGMSDFLFFINEAIEQQEFNVDFEVSPKFQITEETLGAELVQIILSGTATLIPLFIKLFDEYQKYKNAKSPLFAKIEKIELMINGEQIIIEGKDLNILIGKSLT